MSNTNFINETTFCKYDSGSKSKSDFHSVTIRFRRGLGGIHEDEIEKVKNQLEDLTHRNELRQKELKIELANDERDTARENVKIEESIGNYESRIIWFLIFTIVLILGLIVYGIKRITKEQWSI